jgi:hypothetical protein
MEWVGKLLAERVGFEPTIPLPVYHLSRVASSTAPAPLQVHSSSIDAKKYTKNVQEMQFDNRLNPRIFLINERNGKRHHLEVQRS